MISISAADIFNYSHKFLRGAYFGTSMPSVCRQMLRTMGLVRHHFYIGRSLRQSDHHGVLQLVKRI